MLVISRGSKHVVEHVKVTSGHPAFVVVKVTQTGASFGIAPVIFVAALDEVPVIDQTVEGLLDLDHPRFVVCVGDDSPGYATPEILAGYAEDQRVSVLRRHHPRTQTGKSGCPVAGRADGAADPGVGSRDR